MCFYHELDQNGVIFLLTPVNLAHFRGTVGIYATVNCVPMLNYHYLQVHSVKKSEFKLKI